MGGFWEGSQIPVEIKDIVCGIAAEKPYDLADRLSVTEEQLLGKEKTNVNTVIVRNILSIWFENDPDAATLEKLFAVLNRMNRLKLLKAKLEQRVGKL